MSRSYKKTPWCGDNKGKIKKRYASKALRSWSKEHSNILLKGNEYKKIYSSYDICDYGWVCSWEKRWKQIIEEYYYILAMNHDNEDISFPDKEEEFYKWYKYYKMK